MLKFLLLLQRGTVERDLWSMSRPSWRQSGIAAALSKALRKPGGNSGADLHSSLTDGQSLLQQYPDMQQYFTRIDLLTEISNEDMEKLLQQLAGKLQDVVHRGVKLNGLNTYPFVATFMYMILQGMDPHITHQQYQQWLGFQNLDQKVAAYQSIVFPIQVKDTNTDFSDISLGSRIQSVYVENSYQL